MNQLEYFIEPAEVQKLFLTNSVQHYQNLFGGGLPHFYGSHTQKGQGIFSDFVRTHVVPALSRAAPHVIKGVSKIFKDVSRGRNVKQSIKKRGASTLKNAAKSIIGGRRKKRKTRKTRKTRKVKKMPRKTNKMQKVPKNFSLLNS